MHNARRSSCVAVQKRPRRLAASGALLVQILRKCRTEMFCYCSHDNVTFSSVNASFHISFPCQLALITSLSFQVPNACMNALITQPAHCCQFHNTFFLQKDTNNTLCSGWFAKFYKQTKAICCKKRLFCFYTAWECSHVIATVLACVISPKNVCFKPPTLTTSNSLESRFLSDPAYCADERPTCILCRVCKEFSLHQNTTT